VRLEGLGQLKKIHLIRTQTRDLLACSIVPQPTTLPRAPKVDKSIRIYGLLYKRAIKIRLHPRSFNRAGGFNLSQSWYPVYNMITHQSRDKSKPSNPMTLTPVQSPWLCSHNVHTDSHTVQKVPYNLTIHYGAASIVAARVKLSFDVKRTDQ
jgi:hypothetical protein